MHCAHTASYVAAACLGQLLTEPEGDRRDESTRAIRAVAATVRAAIRRTAQVLTPGAAPESAAA